MNEMARRKNTIKYVVPNLRQRWHKELELFTDNAIAAAYEDFSLSDDFGDNDVKFPEWFSLIAEMTTKEDK